MRLTMESMEASLVPVNEDLKLGPIKRVRMPSTRSGRAVGDRHACGLGHLHPSFRHALTCRTKWRKAQRG